MAVVHLPIKFDVDIGLCIQSRVIDIFAKFKMAAAAILDFQFICEFGHSGVLTM